MHTTHCRLTVEQVRDMLDTLRSLECPHLREFVGTLLVEQLCRDWLEMRAAQADSRKGAE